MENSVSSAALNAAREQLDAAEAAREVILLQHIANGVIIDARIMLALASPACSVELNSRHSTVPW